MILFPIRTFVAPQRDTGDLFGLYRLARLACHFHPARPEALRAAVLSKTTPLSKRG